MTYHKSSDELRAVNYSGSVSYGVEYILACGGKKLVLTSVCFFSLSFKWLHVFLKDLNIIRDTETTLQYLFLL